MATVVIQLGQCGNQLGEHLFDGLFQSAACGYFSPGDRPGARSVLIDMEPKVVDRLHRASHPWSYDRKSSFVAQSGSGNNWAFGFNYYGPNTREQVENVIMREVEKCDRLDSFMILHSVAGGTGSGLGAHTLGLLSDAFPSHPLAAAMCFPFETGDVNVQSYNAMMSLVAGVEYADIIFFLDNAEYRKIAADNMRSTSFADINRSIAFNMAGALGVGSLSSIVEQCGSHPLYKLVTTRGLPQVFHEARAFTDHSWESLGKGMEEMIANRQLIDHRGSRLGSNCAVASYAVARGAKLTCDPLQFHGTLWTRAWAPHTTITDDARFQGFDRSLFVVRNDQTPCRVLDKLWQTAACMVSSRAYVHHFENHGVERADFDAALLALAQIIADYEKIGE